MIGDTNVIWRRCVAHVLDNVVVVALALAVAAAAGDETGGVFFALLIALTLLELIVLQGITGWTPGKWVLGVRVVDERGKPPGIGAAIKRTLPLLLEWTALIAVIAMFTHPRAQRFGDRWAHTYVVRAPRRGEATGREAVPA